VKKKTENHNPFSAADQARFALAYEANAAAFALALTEAAGGETRREPDFALALFPYPHSISGIYLPRFTGDNCAERLKLVQEIANQQKKKLTFRIGPAPQPSDLTERLVEMGWRKAITQKYMAVPLATASPLLAQLTHRPTLEGLNIYPVEDYATLYQKRHPRLGEINSAKKRCLVEAYQRLSEQNPRQHWTFLAELDGKVIASVGLFLHQNSLAGFDLLVLPDYRRLGVGSAMLRHIAQFASERGASLGVLASSIEGLHFYPTLGVAHTGAYPIYSFTR